MEVRGEDFVKNLEIERRKTKLEEERLKLEKQKEQSVILNSNNNIENTFVNEPFIGDPVQNNELDDIKLEDKKNNKQNYIILGFAFVLLFLITIIIIRLVSDPDTKSNLDDNSFIQTETTEEIVSTKNNDETVNEPNTNEVINKALNIDKIESNEDNTQEVATPVSNKSTSSNTKNTELQNNIFEIKEQEAKTDIDEVKTTKPKPVYKHKTVKKKKVNPYKNIVIKDEYKPSTKISSSKIRGYFIQIGAFSKRPNQKLLSKLDRANLDYKLHKMTINGRKYIKLLVGPYRSNSAALNRLNKTRKISGNNKAYIIRFK